MAACTDRLYAVQVYDEAQLSQLGKHDLEKAGLAPEETMRICNHYHAVSGKRPRQADSDSDSDSHLGSSKRPYTGVGTGQSCGWPAYRKDCLSCPAQKGM